MSHAQATVAEEEYLQTIFWLQEAGLPMTGANVARAMQLSAPTVHEMLGRLERDGYVTRGEDRVIAFTNDGRTHAEEITSRLGRVQGLGVISRTSASQYGETDKSVREIGRELGVEYVLEGSVRWEGSGGAMRAMSERFCWMKSTAARTASAPPAVAKSAFKAAPSCCPRPTASDGGASVSEVQIFESATVAAAPTKATLSADLNVRPAAACGDIRLPSPRKLKGLARSSFSPANAGGQPSCAPAAMKKPTSAQPQTGAMIENSVDVACCATPIVADGSPTDARKASSCRPTFW